MLGLFFSLPDSSFSLPLSLPLVSLSLLSHNQAAGKVLSSAQHHRQQRWNLQGGVEADDDWLIRRQRQSGRSARPQQSVLRSSSQLISDRKPCDCGCDQQRAAGCVAGSLRTRRLPSLAAACASLPSPDHTASSPPVLRFLIREARVFARTSMSECLHKILMTTHTAC